MFKENYSEHQRVPMQYLIIDAAPDPTFAHDKVYGGAKVGCWIKNQTKKNAYRIAKGWIEDQYSVSDEDYKEKVEGKRYFEQALIDGEVFVFNTFPIHEKT